MTTKRVSSIATLARSRLQTVRADRPLREVSQLLSNTHISLIVVCDQDERMIGVVSKSDVVRQIGRCAGHTCSDTVEGVMTRDVVSCCTTDGLSDVLSIMQVKGLVHIPVVEADGKPSGVVNARDALRELVLEGQYEEALLRDYVMGVGYH